MTTNDLISGRPAARSPLFTASIRLLCVAALCLAALPVFADPRISASDAAALSMISSPAPAIDALAMPDRGLMFSANINHLATVQAARTSASDAASGDRLHSVLRRAMALLGTPYRWGGTSPERGFDCSGLVDYVFRVALGINLPRVSRDQANAGVAVADRSQMIPGDLVFFGHGGRVDHVGIYVGDGEFVHAPRTGKDVRISRMDGGYWNSKFMKARRIAL